MASPVFKIAPTTQQYEWGKVGRKSKVAQFSSTLSDFILDDAAPYAELWMGTHPKSPSRVLESGEVLSKHLAQHPELMGQATIAHFGAIDGSLPFLFKVLSIEKALSIQSHPDKKTAQELYKNQPDIYKDPNHKPEMALAITPFQALCGFRPLFEIASFLRSTPELSALIPDAIARAFLDVVDNEESEPKNKKAALQDLFSALMTADGNKVQTQLRRLVARYEGVVGVVEGVASNMVSLVRRLDQQFPGDIGVFCVYLLNYIHLDPGDAIYLGAGEPHAYLSGECIECMANSDNVIRAGLTPKLRDVPNLLAGLTYVAMPAAKHTMKPTRFAPSSTLYDPPAPEFAVIRVEMSISKGEIRKSEEHVPLMGPSITIVTEGEGEVQWGEGASRGVLKLKTGDVFFIGAGTSVRFETEVGIVLYRAFVEAK